MGFLWEKEVGKLRSRECGNAGTAKNSSRILNFPTSQFLVIAMFAAFLGLGQFFQYHIALESGN